MKIARIRKIGLFVLCSSFFAGAAVAQAGETVIRIRTQSIESLAPKELSLFNSLVKASLPNGVVDRALLEERDLFKVAAKFHEFHSWVLTGDGVQCLCNKSTIQFPEEFEYNPWKELIVSSVKSHDDSKALVDLMDESNWSQLDKIQVLQSCDEAIAAPREVIYCGCLDWSFPNQFE